MHNKFFAFGIAVPLVVILCAIATVICVLCA